MVISKYRNEQSNYNAKEPTWTGATFVLLHFLNTAVVFHYKYKTVADTILKYVYVDMWLRKEQTDWNRNKQIIVNLRGYTILDQLFFVFLVGTCSMSWFTVLNFYYRNGV